MASQTRNVVRYTALLGGLFYGIVHQGTLQTKYDLEKAKHKEEHRAHLIEEAKEAYKQKLLAEKAGPTSLITDIENPKFDLEKLIEHWTKQS